MVWIGDGFHIIIVWKSAINQRVWCNHYERKIATRSTQIDKYVVAVFIVSRRATS